MMTFHEWMAHHGYWAGRCGAGKSMYQDMYGKYCREWRQNNPA
ncbi:hypothetical protein CPT_Mendera_044 [Stenotrophomonas phage Mendera]|uniref:Uncharacterized protein n=2 Tax=Menderavirus TaxID=2843421 RepID=A0A482IHA7_9CAUD|nr:hypothetical protein HWC11_gp049 [Stenotrophomonas phage YB07]YP_009851101.1 hypothetical protein HWC60_gp044 [Stenotrophomonas phage Mendera]QXN67418.1 hypothetical protein [Stenotrophomonas phage BUCT608]QBP06245.1 hypothetical protein [Stenotrophomonas phage YB07]QFR56593.1 hypothetical protein CPT_Mendera_044 [Stenotrophomonas phage Mendera]QYC97556.1 hypothetical protein [Stenotrophomonas phage BUCT608]